MRTLLEAVSKLEKTDKRSKGSISRQGRKEGDDV